MQKVQFMIENVMCISIAIFVGILSVICVNFIDNIENTMCLIPSRNNAKLMKRIMNS
jgi:hypothetical protein